jgi:hypothetical protein
LVKMCCRRRSFFQPSAPLAAVQRCTMVRFRGALHEGGRGCDVVGGVERSLGGATRVAPKDGAG